ncbi:hypothetical protein Rsub_03620 [Raphidocelis subcapitata]|uniref:procollagen-proline 4-dioxygenase n=1 Tax=Raphidocelis subcapitata TaxID=307507 RepID=A0A2V0P0D3_9CHLO|nr:hypothetical protein Rsub_03620 [Raphidocelis subcapitata]|eukprot:GBF91300.1 hypothetical protein Rsub_03620 [Raphidocelis subcapitata]
MAPGPRTAPALAAAAAAAALLLALLAAPRGAAAFSVGDVAAARMRAAAAAAEGGEPAKPADPAAAHDAAGAAAAAAAFAAITGEPSAAAADAAARRRGAPLIRMLSWSPRAMLWEGFASAAECDHLASLAAPHLAKSDVVDSDTGEVVQSRERTSSGWFLPRRRADSVVAELEERIARWAQIPASNGEPFHILRYNPKEEYTAHFDSFHDQVNVQNGGQRIATVILYLSDVEEGGETVFPDSPTRPSEAESAGFSACARNGLGVRPRKGDALLFFSLKPDGVTQDATSLHAGCPVGHGTKWIATKWIRVGQHQDWGQEGEEGGTPLEGEPSHSEL